MKKRKLKLISFLGFLFAAILLLFGVSNSKASAATTADDYVPDDPSIYDVSWTAAKVKYWNYKRSLMFGIDKTYSYIRITDKNDNFIDNLTRLEATFKIDGEIIHVNNELDYLDKNGYVGWPKKEGTLYTMENWEESSSLWGLNQEECYIEFDDYQECNYVWYWTYDVKEIVYLYVWYLDPLTGEEVAASFMPNGEHPKYNADGTLAGIYDTEGNLLEGYGLSDKGIPSTIITDANGVVKFNELVLWDDQCVDIVEHKTFDFSTFQSAWNSILTIGGIILGIIVFCLLWRFGRFVINTFRSKR